MRGDGRRARELLDGTGQALAGAGRFAEAAEVFSALTGPNTVTLKPSSHVSTFGQMAQVRLNQLQVQTGMEATLGRKADPLDVGWVCARERMHQR